MVLLKRYYCAETVDGDTECFVEDGFWYTEVRVVLHLLAISAKGEKLTLGLTERHHHQMDRLRPLLHHILWLVRRRPHPRKETVTKGSTATLVSPRTFLPPFHMFHKA